MAYKRQNSLNKIYNFFNLKKNLLFKLKDPLGGKGKGITVHNDSSQILKEIKKIKK
jgi:hypothetical protein